MFSCRSPTTCTYFDRCRSTSYKNSCQPISRISSIRKGGHGGVQGMRCITQISYLYLIHQQQLINVLSWFLECMKLSSGWITSFFSQTLGTLFNDTPIYVLNINNYLFLEFLESILMLNVLLENISKRL